MSWDGGKGFLGCYRLIIPCHRFEKSIIDFFYEFWRLDFFDSLKFRKAERARFKRFFFPFLLDNVRMKKAVCLHSL